MFVAFYSSAEIGVFEALGWKHPVNVLDLYTEFRWLTNGQVVVNKNGKSKSIKRGLLDAMAYFGIEDAISAETKNKMRDLVLSLGPWSPDEHNSILDYCESDVLSLEKLFGHMVNKIDLPRALLRGRYMCAVAKMEFTGIPIDTHILSKLTNNWNQIRDQLIINIDKSYGVYEGSTFKSKRFEQYLNNKGISWPRLPSGALDLQDETFKSMSALYPELQSLKELRSTLSKMRLIGLQVGNDGRNRCLYSPFSSTTGRNQPSTNKFIFGPAAWFRGLMRARKNYALIYADWSQQEFGIASALSGDVNMTQAYFSGDPYLSFARQAGAVPENATKESHKLERELYKSCALAQQYGMGAQSLAVKINRPEIEARHLISLHHKTYPQFWAWSDNVLIEAQIGRRKLWTKFGWQIHAGMNSRSLRNFPVQAAGAEMMRIAAIMLVAEGIVTCAPIHDAFLVEAPLSELDDVVKRTQEIMGKASRIVLDGFELASDIKIVKSPERYMDSRGLSMWNMVMELIDEPKY